MNVSKFQKLKQMVESLELKARKPDLVINIEDEASIEAAGRFFLADKVRAQAMLDLGIQCRKLERRMFEELRLKYPQLEGLRFGVNYNEQTGAVQVTVYEDKEEETCPTLQTK